ncbi:MAG: hypothetical protein LBS28_01370 [Streptococcaceae bacterium]|nr:hypothetical protein [Streptococcaceae bacterium]
MIIYRQAAYFYANLVNLGKIALNTKKADVEERTQRVLDATRLKRRNDLNTWE